MARLIPEEQFLKEVQFVKSAENINDLVTEGGFYTEKEMREGLKFSQCPVIRLETMNMFFFGKSGFNKWHVVSCMYWFGYFMFVLYDVRSEDQNPEGRGAWATRPIFHDATCRSFIPGIWHSHCFGRSSL